MTSLKLWSRSFDLGFLCDRPRSSPSSPGHPVKVQHGSSESNDATRLEGADRPILTNAGLRRCVRRRSCHSNQLSCERRQRQVLTAFGRSRLATHSARLGMLFSIITGHQAMRSAHGRLCEVAMPAARHQRAGRKSGRRTAPGPDLQSSPNLHQSMRHISATLRSSARPRRLECRVSSTNETGIVYEAWQRHGARLREMTTRFSHSASQFYPRTSL